MAGGVFGSCGGVRRELVMATCLSRDRTDYPAGGRAGFRHDSVLNRTSGSLEQLLDTANAENVGDLTRHPHAVATPSGAPKALALLDSAPYFSQKLVPRSIRSTFRWR